MNTRMSSVLTVLTILAAFASGVWLMLGVSFSSPTAWREWEWPSFTGWDAPVSASANAASAEPAPEPPAAQALAR